MTLFPVRRALLMGLPAMLMVLPAILVACGGDDDDGDNGGGGGVATDEAYVRDICGAMRDLETALVQITEDADSASSLSDLEEALEDLAGAFNDAADQMEDANPPSDVEESHNAIIEVMRDAAEALEDGDINALAEFDPDTDFEPSQETQDRLAAVAADTEECQGLEVFDAS